MPEYVISKEQLEAALAEIKRAEGNGFNFCLAVFNQVSGGMMLVNNILEYSDLIEKAHPTNPRLNWGRFQQVTKHYKFNGEKLIPIKDNRPRKVKLLEVLKEFKR